MLLTMSSPAVAYLREQFARLADPASAKAMAAYMKTSMPFYGIKKPQRLPVLREMDQRYPIASRAQYLKTVDSLWAQPHREMKYAAIHVAVKHAEFITPASMPLYRRMIIEGAWWDLVDEISIRLVGRLTLLHPDSLGDKMDHWIDDANMWIRRSALISHNKHREETSRKRLFDHSLKCAHEREFFIRKAIGWALREYADTAPDAVRRFLCEHRGRFSTLTFREAAKHLNLEN